MRESEEDLPRFIFIDTATGTVCLKDCHDVDEVEQQLGFASCPVCGGKRFDGFLMHEFAYNGVIH